MELYVHLLCGSEEQCSGGKTGSLCLNLSWQMFVDIKNFRNVWANNKIRSDKRMPAN